MSRQQDDTNRLLQQIVDGIAPLAASLTEIAQLVRNVQVTPNITAAPTTVHAKPAALYVDHGAWIADHEKRIADLERRVATLEAVQEERWLEAVQGSERALETIRAANPGLVIERADGSIVVRAEPH